MIPGDPGTPEPWRALDELLGRRYTHAVSGALLPISATFVDSGGHHTGAVYAFARERLRRKVFACRGASDQAAPILSKPTRANAAKVALYTVGVSALKESFYSRLRIERPGPGYIHLPTWVSGEVLEQLTGEKRMTRYSKGRPFREWRQTRERVEALDSRNYAHAALHFLGVKTIAKLAQWAEHWRKGTPGATPEPEPQPVAERPNIFPLLRQQQRQRTGSWVNRW
jgi:phage terminase large subunit GpA-like protein